MVANGVDSDRMARFRRRIFDLVQVWATAGIPPRDQLVEQARQMQSWKTSQKIPGLGKKPPLTVADFLTFLLNWNPDA